MYQGFKVLCYRFFGHCSIGGLLCYANWKVYEGQKHGLAEMDGFTRWLINHTFDGIDQYPSDKLRPDILYPKNQVTD
jgi:hypothetical protein